MTHDDPEPEGQTVQKRKRNGNSGGVRRLMMSLLKPGGRYGKTNLNESIEEVLDEQSENGRIFSAEERIMLKNLLNFGELRVSDAMVPRPDIIAVDVSTSIFDLIRLFKEAGHSRMPVYRETLDDPIGMVHIKDLLSFIVTDDEEGAGKQSKKNHAPRIDPKPSLQKLTREVLFVPPSMPAADLLLRMQTVRIHMALVIDEYGGTDGLVTIEDLVELIVGDIEDEHDSEDNLRFAPLDGGGFEADARLEIKDFEEQAKIKVGLEDREEDIDTLGGLVFSLVGRVPRRGEVIRHPAGYDFEVVEADPRRIKRLKIIKAAKRKKRPGGTTVAA